MTLIYQYKVYCKVSRVYDPVRPTNPHISNMKPAHFYILA